MSKGVSGVTAVTTWVAGILFVTAICTPCWFKVVEVCTGIFPVQTTPLISGKDEAVDSTRGLAILAAVATGLSGIISVFRLSTKVDQSWKAYLFLQMALLLLAFIAAISCLVVFGLALDLDVGDLGYSFWLMVVSMILISASILLTYLELQEMKYYIDKVGRKRKHKRVPGVSTWDNCILLWEIIAMALIVTSLGTKCWMIANESVAVFGGQCTSSLFPVEDNEEQLDWMEATRAMSVMAAITMGACIVINLFGQYTDQRKNKTMSLLGLQITSLVMAVIFALIALVVYAAEAGRDTTKAFGYSFWTFMAGTIAVAIAMVIAGLRLLRKERQEEDNYKTISNGPRPTYIPAGLYPQHAGMYPQQYYAQYPVPAISSHPTVTSHGHSYQ